MNTFQFIAKRIYPSDQGLHMEFATVAEAQAFYEDGLSRGITNNELCGVTVNELLSVAYASDSF